VINALDMSEDFSPKFKEKYANNMKMRHSSSSSVDIDSFDSSPDDNYKKLKSLNNFGKLFGKGDIARMAFQKYIKYNGEIRLHFHMPNTKDNSWYISIKSINGYIIKFEITYYTKSRGMQNKVYTWNMNNYNHKDIFQIISNILDTHYEFIGFVDKDLKPINYYWCKTLVNYLSSYPDNKQERFISILGLLILSKIIYDNIQNVQNVPPRVYNKLLSLLDMITQSGFYPLYIKEVDNNKKIMISEKLFYKDNKSNKFWEILAYPINDSDLIGEYRVTITWGRYGSNGRKKESSMRYMQIVKLIESKKKKGYK